MKADFFDHKSRMVNIYRNAETQDQNFSDIDTHRFTQVDTQDNKKLYLCQGRQSNAKK